MSTYPQSTTRRVLFRLSLNSFWLLIARVAGQALAILFTIFVARALGTGAFGSFAFISSIVFIGNVITTFGLDTLVIRDVARQRDPSDKAVRETMAAALFIQLALSILFILVVWVVGGRWVVQSGDETTALRIAVVSLLPLAFSTIFSAALRGYERMAAYMLFSVVVAAVSALGGLLLYRQGGSLVSAAWVVLIAQLSGAIVAFALYQSHPSSKMGQWLLSRRALRRVWRGGLSLATLMVLAVLYQRLGIIAPSVLGSDTAPGLYSAAA
ncbi:MAG TPA: oligosaccharide flippase family protein, partial [Promineifilum sp.]|nr:oligosaccharide flippase family protein [Promineifilum sp.]